MFNLKVQRKEGTEPQKKKDNEPNRKQVPNGEFNMY